jgi:hypothetical protein
VFCVFGVLLLFPQSVFLSVFLPQDFNMAASVLSSARCLSGASNTFGLSSNNAGAGAGQTVRRYSVVQVNAIAEKTSADTEVPQDVLECKLYCVIRPLDVVSGNFEDCV